MTSVTVYEQPAAATMLLPHGPAGVSRARRRLSSELAGTGALEAAVDDAALVLSELLSNAFRHGSPLAAPPDAEMAGPPGPVDAVADGGRDGGAGGNGGPGGQRHGGTIRVGWRIDDDGLLTLEVTDGGGATRPRAPRPSVTAHGGRGLGIVDALSLDWGVRDGAGEVTVWAVVPLRARHARRSGFRRRPARTPARRLTLDDFDDLV